jgi:hypothetical protein
MLKENVWLKVFHMRDCKKLKHIEMIYTVHGLFLKEEESNHLITRKDTTCLLKLFQQSLDGLSSGCLFSVFPRVMSLRLNN